MLDDCVSLPSLCDSEQKGTLSRLRGEAFKLSGFLELSGGIDSETRTMDDNLHLCERGRKEMKHTKAASASSLTCDYDE